ncbi:hypothetical protein GCM10011581_23410 [Saccharopolyspora subtropica]|uniref:Uncharacterized protein n=1 Tax=Saccharopolyspora thermophila TaxID=89367 RepID=A0A917NBW5_9PSEU|nr:hypothetical protein [Saccharopolyspora subtropica]GGI85637.1 hypothetical protein GCM10011581_23410 [Saccharopolyspora subtropica]
MDPETPEADAAEQVRPAEDVLDEEEPGTLEVPLDADPADAADQSRPVPLDDAYDHD